MRQPDPPLVRAFQYAILAGFTIFALSVLVWVGHLIRVSVRWHDSFSASLAISIIAIPVFAFILGLVHYLFWGLRKYRSEEDEEHPGGGESKLLSLLVCGLVLLSSVSVRAEDPPNNPLVGWRTFVAKRCVVCHSIDGVGGTKAPDLGKVDLSVSQMELIAKIWNYAPQMAATFDRVGVPYPEIDADEMSRLLPFLYFLGFFDPAGDPNRGEQIYLRAPCHKCHGNQAEGGSGPSLSAVASGRAAISLATAIWNHGPRMAQDIRKMGIEFPIFTSRELLDMVSFIREKALPPETALELQVVGNPRNGIELLRVKGCLTCHALRGDGGKTAPDFAKAMDLARSQTLLVTALWNHGPRMWKGMAAKGIKLPSLSNEEMVDMITGLFFLRFQSERGDPKRGERLLAEKGCAACHLTPGSGSTKEAPDLFASDLLGTDAGVASALWNHLPTMREKMEKTGRPWPEFKAGELGDLVAYLRSKAEE